jgi:hypothetical protein
MLGQRVLACARCGGGVKERRGTEEEKNEKRWKGRRRSERESEWSKRS